MGCEIGQRGGEIENHKWGECSIGREYVFRCYNQRNKIKM
jgi:hypothetical protein